MVAEVPILYPTRPELVGARVVVQAKGRYLGLVPLGGWWGGGMREGEIGGLGDGGRD